MPPDEPVSDDGDAWIAQAQRLDAETLGRLLNRFRPLLRTRAKESLGAAVHARVDESDIVQQTFLSACRAISEFQGTTEREFIHWLLRILERNILQAVEREQGAAKRDVGREVAGVVLENEAVDQRTSPSRRLLREEQKKMLLDALEQLPEGQREAVRLKFLEQATLSETARRLGKSEDAVSGLLMRGVSRLNQLLRMNGLDEV